ncbi:TAXI family TRAP transporter solute-binding subunit [Leptothrix ochracea]|uniref:TAXI family TRAP transporter solute-binding subunit n=1 Tax=Leptothrix ochracea TaxID=735331 RepID=UPI0034E19DD7
MVGIIGPYAALGVILLGFVFWMIDPIPPRHLRLATGSTSGSYHEIFGPRYQEQLKHVGIEVELIPSKGAIENLRLLQTHQVDAAFFSTLSPTAKESPEVKPLLTASKQVTSLGTLLVQPLWIFYRADAARRYHHNLGLHQLHQGNHPDTLKDLRDFKGWRFNIGHMGGASREILLEVFKMGAGLKASDFQASAEEYGPAAAYLLAGQVDAIGFTAIPELPLVQHLLTDPNIRLFEFSQASAYARQIPQLRAVMLPRGIADLHGDIPSHDIPLIATTGSLLVHDDTHPALQVLLAQAAQHIHSPPSWVQQRNEFPKAETDDFPLDSEAAQFYRNGPPRLQHLLPFWAANLIDRMWLAVLSIVIIVMPLMRGIPPIYVLQVRWRIFRWYRKLQTIDDELVSGKTPPDELMQRLNALDARVAMIEMPSWNSAALYALRAHIALVQKNIQASQAQAPAPALAQA